MQRMRQDSGDRESVGLGWVEPNDGRLHFGPGAPQSEKDCSVCIHFDKDLAMDHPCGLCYESEDKNEWTTKDVRCGEMEYPSERVCEASVGKGRC
jgi:hypothetical protein